MLKARLRKRIKSPNNLATTATPTTKIAILARKAETLAAILATSTNKRALGAPIPLASTPHVILVTLAVELVPDLAIIVGIS
jgi:hypothetical protein